MKAILEIELEFDGRWKKTDRDKLVDMILENPGRGGWNIAENRLLVFAKSLTCRLVKSRTARQ